MEVVQCWKSTDGTWWNNHAHPHPAPAPSILHMKVAQLCPTLCNPMDSPWNSPGQNTGLGSRSLLQGIVPTQGLNPGLPLCKLYQLSHHRCPSILEWVAYPFSSRSSWPRNQTRVSCTAGRFFTSWAIRHIFNFKRRERQREEEEEE